MSVSVPDDDVRFLDEYARAHGMASRSAVVQAAIRGLRTAELQDAYGEAFTAWESEGETAVWDPAAGDGL
nr:ribbon-helix-helix domain-containing protein [Conexibacter arvalis]